MTDPWTSEAVLKLVAEWQEELHPKLVDLYYPEDRSLKQDHLPNALLHDGNRAANMSRIACGQDQEHALRVRWGYELSWFIKFGKYMLLMEGAPS